MVNIHGAKGRVEVFNFLGVKVAQANTHSDKISLDLSGNPGKYFVRVGTRSYKVVIGKYAETIKSPL